MVTFESDTSVAIEVEIQYFFKLLLSNVDFKADDAVDFFKELQNLPKKYGAIIIIEVSDLILYLFFCIHNVLYVRR